MMSNNEILAKFISQEVYKHSSPGVEYTLPGDYPMEELSSEKKSGGQHGGLDRWFAEKWVDIKTGKECGRQEGEKRSGYPACRPSKRVSKDTPKTVSELSSSEKEKFKRTKTSSERIPYQHKRKDQGGLIYNDMEYNTDMEFMKDGGNVPTNPELWSRAKSAAKAKYDVYPSAYANGYAAKWYKERGGGWKKKAEMGGCMECGGQMEEGGQSSGMLGIEDALGEIAFMIQDGTDPTDIMRMLIEEGMSEEQAQDIVESAQEDLSESDDYEEEDPDMDDSEIDDLLLMQSSDEQMKNGGIKINPAKKGTFKAQATRMGMSVQEAASYILENKDKFSPAMVKKANFAKNFAKELGGEMFDLEEMKNGGGIPPRYRKLGFTKVGAKRKSTRPGKKWMVLAKKGDKYKVVHGGWKGMSDYTQHRNEKRRDRFWDRMGGKQSAKAKDPFSPLYWHKRFGTWDEGGAIPKDPLGYEGYVEGDNLYTTTTKNKIENLKNNGFNRTLATLNTLGDPRNMVWALPNKGLLGKIKGIAGLASGLSGAVLGYEKLFAEPKTEQYINNYKTNEYGTMEDVLAARKAKQAKENPAPATTPAPSATTKPLSNMTRTGGSGMGAMEYLEQQDQDLFIKEMGGFMYGDRVVPLFMVGGQNFEQYVIAGEPQPMSYDEWLAANGRGLMGEEMRDRKDYDAYVASFGPMANPTQPVVPSQNPAQPNNANAKPGQQTNTWSYSNRGDSIGQVAANNALTGLAMFRDVLDAEDREKEYKEMLRRTGNTMERYNPQNAVNPFGRFTLNSGIGQNYGLVANPAIQDFGTGMAAVKYGGQKNYQQGGEYYLSEDEIKQIIANGGEIEFLD